ncbi:hypothetical protein AC1031_020017 [Aphanomyces cochlioides]|nr:hypothetical protein AC1031_020017 [Aphanomyces cochlioides]
MNESSCSDDSDAVPPVSLRSKKKRKVQSDQRTAGAVIGNAVAKLVEVEIAKLKTMSTTKSDATQYNSRLEHALDSLSLIYEHLSAGDIATMADIIGVGHNSTIFHKLDGAIRDAWVQNQLAKKKDDATMD